MITLPLLYCKKAWYFCSSCKMFSKAKKPWGVSPELHYPIWSNSSHSECFHSLGSPNDKKTAIAAENRNSLQLDNRVCYCLYICTRRSAEMLILLMVKVISIDRLRTVKCCAGKSWHLYGCQVTQTSHPNGQAHPTWCPGDMGAPAEQWGTWRAQDIHPSCEWAAWNIHKHAQPLEVLSEEFDHISHHFL